MLIGYSQPAISGSVGIASGGGLAASAWLTADGGAALFDGRPSRKARLQWGTGTASIAHYVAITATFAAATPLRILALLGTTLPVGCRVDFLGAGGDGLGGFCDDCRTVRMPDGTVGVWGVAREGDPAETGIEVRIYNDVDGATWASSGTIVDIGEVLSMPGVSVAIDVGHVMATIDPTEVELTRNGYPNVVARSAYRQLSCNFSPLPSGAATVREGGLANGMDWDSLVAALRGRARCAVIPQHKTVARVQSTALYAVATEIGETQQLRGQFYRRPMTFQEIPAR